MRRILPPKRPPTNPIQNSTLPISACVQAAFYLSTCVALTPTDLVCNPLRCGFLELDSDPLLSGISEVRRILFPMPTQANPIQSLMLLAFVSVQPAYCLFAYALCSPMGRGHKFLLYGLQEPDNVLLWRKIIGLRRTLPPSMW